MWSHWKRFFWKVRNILLSSSQAREEESEPGFLEHSAKISSRAVFPPSSLNVLLSDSVQSWEAGVRDKITLLSISILTSESQKLLLFLYSVNCEQEIKKLVQMMKVTSTIKHVAAHLNVKVMYHSDMWQSMCEKYLKKRLVRYFCWQRQTTCVKGLKQKKHEKCEKLCCYIKAHNI